MCFADVVPERINRLCGVSSNDMSGPAGYEDERFSVRGRLAAAVGKAVVAGLGERWPVELKVGDSGAASLRGKPLLDAKPSRRATQIPEARMSMRI